MNPRVAPSPARTDLIQTAFRLEWLTIAWMSVEAGVAIVAGAAAGSVTLLAFGIDSLIELTSACVLIWRLNTELRHGGRFSERAEGIAGKTGGALLFGLAGYIVVAAILSLHAHHGGSFSVPGLLVALAAIPAMYGLARRKLDVARRLGSRAMRADAVESLTCGWLSLVVVIGLAARWLLGAWWVDAVTSLGIVWFVVKEGREAWRREDCCGDHC